MTSIQRPVTIAWPTTPVTRALECSAAVVANSTVATVRSWDYAVKHDPLVLVSPFHFANAASRAWMAGAASAIFTYNLYANPGIALGG